MGYGALVHPYCSCCGIVLPPAPAYEEQTCRDEQLIWEEYLNALDFDERREMTCLWQHADAQGRRELLKKLSLMRQQLKEEQEKGDPNRPLTDEELKRWDEYVKTLKGKERREAEEAWKKADNREKREMLAEIESEKDVRARPARRVPLARR
jgi:hypothetical protein